MSLGLRPIWSPNRWSLYEVATFGLKDKNMNEAKRVAHPAALILISTCGEPVMLVPAPSVQEALQRAKELLRASLGDKGAVAEHGCQVTLFAPAIEAGGEILGYQPIQVADSGTANMRSRIHRTAN